MRQLELFGEYQIMLATQRDRGFYNLMGPFFSSAAVVKELEGPIFDSPAHHWLIVKHGGRVVAFSSWRTEKNGVTWFNQTWVAPEHRRRGIYRRLFEIKQNLAIESGAQVLKGTALTHSRALFDQHGWSVTSARGPRWTWFEKRLEAKTK